MVTQISENRTNYYICDECGLIYSDIKLAKKCEAHWRLHQENNAEITKFAVDKD